MDFNAPMSSKAFVLKANVLVSFWPRLIQLFFQVGGEGKLEDQH